ncbi:MAG: hypothetical protein KC415_10900 [Anaerolineales bacterium]|nr:hypothetical protein [Anaerolineales bacterium]
MNTGNLQVINAPGQTLHFFRLAHLVMSLKGPYFNHGMSEKQPLFVTF